MFPVFIPPIFEHPVVLNAVGNTEWSNFYGNQR